MARTTRNIRYVSRCALRNPATLANMRCEQAAAEQLRDCDYRVPNRLLARRWQVTAWDDGVVSAWSEQFSTRRRRAHYFGDAEVIRLSRKLSGR